MIQFFFRSLVVASLGLALLGCTGAEADSTKPDAGPPEPVAGSPLCVLSVDCPSGQHCDLGECVQSCSTKDPCTGKLSCSPRARCLPTDQADTDPAPPQERLGVLTVSPASIQLLEDASEFKLTLTNSSASNVDYRVTDLSKFVSVQQRRGSFADSTELTFAVDSSLIEGTDAGGSVKVFTSLGEIVVPIVIKRGITGKYQGALRYTTNGVEMGDARLVVELIDRNGDLNVLVDPERSLLFPDTGSGAATGFGNYDAETGGTFTVVQRVRAKFGGARNHFGRDLGRRLNVTMERSALGGFEGTFEETIHGLFESPIKLQGTIFLSPRFGEGAPDFELGSDVQMPVLVTPAITTLNKNFFAPTDYSGCPGVLDFASIGWPSDDDQIYTDARRYNGLPTLMVKRTQPGTTKSFAEVREICEVELSAKAPAVVECTWHPAVMCASLFACGAIDSSINAPAQFQEFFVATLNPPLLIAQEYAVKALDESLGLGGVANERVAYASASAQLGPVMRYSLHPQIIGYLDHMSTNVAKGTDPGTGDDATSSQTFPAARALARLLQVAATIDGEKSRIDAVEALASDQAALTAAQARGLIGLLEAAVVVHLTETWGITPDMVSADLSGFLTPIDNGFGALVEGARAFGVPDGYIPFVWRPEDSGGAASNFEQMLLLANKTQASTATLEAAYVDNKRRFEDSEDKLLNEMVAIALTYDTQIKDVCGDAFDLNKVLSPKDWKKCGANNAGQVGLALLAIEQSDQRIAEHMSRIQGMRDKLEISQNALNDTQSARGKTLDFLDSSGRSINALTMTIDGLQLAKDGIATASQTSLWNFGGPAIGGAAIVALGAIQLGATAVRADLQLAHELALPKLDGQLELINGMADLKKQVIDIQQALFELNSFALDKVQSQMQANNQVSAAKRLFALRTQAQTVASLNPAHDPSFRLLRDHQSLQLLDSRARSQRMLFLAGRALEYEVNTPLQSLGSAVLSARSSLAMDQLSACLTDISSSYRIAFGNPQKYTSEVSVREMLGIAGPRTDDVTGEELSAGKQFRLITQQSENFDESGGLTITFATNLQPDNGLWSTDVCGDRISGLQAQLVGDSLGDNEAQVNLDLTGAAVLRACDSDALQVWSMSEGTSAGAAKAIIQAGVNSYGATEMNTSLFGQSVARASWQITIPNGAVAPSNSDIDLSQLEDIVLKIEHKAVPRSSTPLNVDLSCLASIN